MQHIALSKESIPV